MFVRRNASTAATVAIGAALLALDGQLGPPSFTLRRASAVAVLAGVACVYPVGLRGTLRQFFVWPGRLAALALVVWAPSVPVALVGFTIALTLLDAGSAQSDHSRWTLPEGALQTCLTYLVVRFGVDLIPEAGGLTTAVAEAAHRWIDYASRSDVRPGVTALGGSGVMLAVIGLLGRWRLVGGVGRLVAAFLIPFAWFGLLPFFTPDASAGPNATFVRGAMHGVAWLGVVTLIDAFLPGRKRGIEAGFPTSTAALLPPPLGKGGR